ncbi:hypothetical protein WN51_03889 [Melipona quadrifasciata]|uniref:Uncharacterized protein n=1 Tax=Melipona quadrifasciata TaxID=166423 RepID=A0A0M8ZRX5_9HYME|nr:hypothetical protein WN51_03889 [Melipona quadrifasciata]
MSWGERIPAGGPMAPSIGRYDINKHKNPKLRDVILRNIKDLIKFETKHEIHHRNFQSGILQRTKYTSNLLFVTEPTVCAQETELL